MSKLRLDPVSEQSIDWMVKLRADTPDAALLERFNAWLAADPAHVHAWDTLQKRLGGSFNTVRALDRRLEHDRAGQDERVHSGDRSGSPERDPA